MNVTMDVVVKWEALFDSLGERFSCDADRTGFKLVDRYGALRPRLV